MQWNFKQFLAVIEMFMTAFQGSLTAMSLATVFWEGLTGEQLTENTIGESAQLWAVDQGRLATELCRCLPMQRGVMVQLLQNAIDAVRDAGDIPSE